MLPRPTAEPCLSPAPSRFSLLRLRKAPHATKSCPTNGDCVFLRTRNFCTNTLVLSILLAVTYLSGTSGDAQALDSASDGGLTFGGGAALSEPTLRLLPMGDSITAGIVNREDEFSLLLARADAADAGQQQRVADAVAYVVARDGYRARLRTALAGMGISVAFQGRIVPSSAIDTAARHEGQPGVRTVGLLYPLAQDPFWLERPARLAIANTLANTNVAPVNSLPSSAGPPLVILLMIGTNDMLSDEGAASALGNLQLIIDQLNLHYDDKACIALASIPPMHCDNRAAPTIWCPTGVSHVAAYNTGVRAIAERSATDRIHYVPVAEGLPAQRSNGQTYALELGENYGDRLHPNEVGYAAIAEVWADVIGKIGRRAQAGILDPCEGPLDPVGVDAGTAPDQVTAPDHAVAIDAATGDDVASAPDQVTLPDHVTASDAAARGAPEAATDQAATLDTARLDLIAAPDAMAASDAAFEPVAFPGPTTSGAPGAMSIGSGWSCGAAGRGAHHGKLLLIMLLWICCRRSSKRAEKRKGSSQGMRSDPPA